MEDWKDNLRGKLIGCCNQSGRRMKTITHMNEEKSVQGKVCALQ